MSKAVAKAAQTILFGPNVIPPEHIFFLSQQSFAFVNISPFKEHHVLVSPLQRIAKFKDLEASLAQRFLEDVRKMSEVMRSLIGEALLIFLQDGKEAGQTVPHVHFHLMPLRAPGIENHRAHTRTFAQMQAEADKLRAFILRRFPRYAEGAGGITPCSRQL